MPYITGIKVADSRTVQPKQYESAKVEREIYVSFSPGELTTEDAAKILMHLKQYGELVAIAVEESLPTTSQVPPKKAEPAKPAPVPPAPTKAEPPKQETKPEPPKDALSGGGDSAMGWPDKVVCKACGKEIPVKLNSKGKPMAICTGSKENSHKAYFLTPTGEFGNEVGYSNPKK